MTYKELLDSEILKEMLDAPNGLIGIDINDIKDLFQQDGEIHAIDVRVNAREENRMERLMDRVKVDANRLGADSRVLVYFFFPEKCPLMMEELRPFSEWIETFPGECMIKWGMATQSAQELRAIVLLQ
jgi:hypothetical protein